MNKIKNFSWTFCGERYKINWTSVLFIGIPLCLIGLLQYLGYV